MALAFQYQPGQTPIDADKAAQLIPQHITTQDQLNEWEQANILEALRWRTRSRHAEVLTEIFCQELHKRVISSCSRTSEGRLLTSYRRAVSRARASWL